MKYRHIVFDLDGTLIGKAIGNNSLSPNKEAPPVTGIKQLIQSLKAMSFSIAVISEHTEQKSRQKLQSLGLEPYINTYICQSAFISSDKNPLQDYLDKTRISSKEILFVTAFRKKLRYARETHADHAQALWYGYDNPADEADYRLNAPHELATIAGNPEGKTCLDPMLSWAIELQFIAQAGLTYSKDPFDLERFDRIREISAEMMAGKSGLSMSKVKELFCNETGFQTPKLDTRAAIFQNGKILMVREKEGKWALPGGWVDVNQSISSNTVKEVREEAGLDVEPERLIAVLDGNRRQVRQYVYGICKLFVLCRFRSGQFQPNIETTESAFFAIDNLPPLFTEKNTLEHIKMCFLAAEDENWQVLFD